MEHENLKYSIKNHIVCNKCIKELSTLSSKDINLLAIDLISRICSKEFSWLLILDNTDTGGRDYRLISTNNAHGSLGGGDFAILDNEVINTDIAQGSEIKNKK